jgi:hypothetical protein
MLLVITFIVTKSEYSTLFESNLTLSVNRFRFHLDNSKRVSSKYCIFAESDNQFAIDFEKGYYTNKQGIF